MKKILRNIFFPVITVAFFMQSEIVCAAPIDSYGAGSVKTEIERSLIEEKLEEEITEKEIKVIEKTEQPKPQDLKLENADAESIANYRIFVSEINFEGSTVYQGKDLIPFAEMVCGKSILLNDLISLASLITRKYHYDGYLTSFAYLPEQEIKDGVVTIKIYESPVKKINYKGNKHIKPRYMTNGILYPSKVREGRIFNINDLDCAMKKFDTETYSKEKIHVTENNNGDTIINISLKERTPFYFDATYDDGGREVIGLQRSRLLLGNNNLTGWGDRAYGGVILASRTTGALAGYSIPIWKYGTRLSFDYGYTNVKLGEEYKEFDLTGKSENFMLKLTQPLYETPQTEIKASVGIDFTHTKSHFGRANRDITDYSLRVIRSAIYGMHDDKYGRSFLSINGDAGINGLGSKGVDNGSPRTSFSKYYFNLIRLQKVPIKDSYFIFRLDGQYSPDKLYPAEAFQLGGFTSLRGYEPGALIGDWGCSGSLEFRTPVPGLKKVLPEKYKSISDRIKFLVFYDFGFIKAHDDTYEYKKSFLHSVGAGLNFFLPAGISLNTAIGMPIGDDIYNRGSVRFHFALTTSVDKLIFHKFEKETSKEEL